MRRRIVAFVAALGLVLAIAGTAFGNTGDEGQPGNQSSGGGGGNTGYEGQPGNQSH